MKPGPNSLFTVLIAGVCLATPVGAQEPETRGAERPGAVTDEVGSGPDLAAVEAALAAMEADSTIDDAAKASLRATYQVAIKALKDGSEFAAEAAKYHDVHETGPGDAARMRKQLQSLPSADDAANVEWTGSTDELEKEIASRQAELSRQEAELAEISRELESFTSQPAEIRERMTAVESRLSEVRKGLVSPESDQTAAPPTDEAERMEATATQFMLRNELEMLKKKQLSLPALEDMLLARSELLPRQIDNDRAALATLTRLLNEWHLQEARRTSARVATLIVDLPAQDNAVKVLAREIQALGQELADVLEVRNRLPAAQADLSSRLTRLTEDYELTAEQLKLGGSGASVAQVLFDLQRQAVNAPVGVRVYELPTLAESRLAWLQAKEKQRRQPALEQQFADQNSEAVAELLKVRSDVLERLRIQYRNLSRTLAEFESDKKQYLARASEVDSAVKKHLLWMKTSPAIGADTFRELPAGLQWAFSRQHWGELGGAARRVLTDNPLRCALVAGITVALLLSRRRLTAVLKQTGVKTRRISTDSHVLTLKALLCTVLLAVPFPLLLAFAGRALGRTPDPSEWLFDLTQGLRMTAQWMFAALFFTEACREGGLGAAHFGWKQERLVRSRRAILQLAVVYIPMVLMTLGYRIHGEAAVYFDSAARIVFILAHIWIAIGLWKLFWSPDGIMVTLMRDHPGGRLARWRLGWFPLLLACPLALAVLAALGYLITAFALSFGLLTTLILMLGGEVLYCLSLRWFLIRERRLALAEAMEKMRARREAADLEEGEPASTEILSVDPDEVHEMDLNVVSQQTRDLLQFSFMLGVAAAICVFWSSIVPVFDTLETIPVPLSEGLTVLGLGQAVLVVIVTCIAVRNLPGLLELGGLRETSMDAGTRHAVFALCQYAVIALGLAALFDVLNLDWEKFGWIAAALSVGLGFGLQEVVANFVCGLILLFERPIRVGDVVTVQAVTGTVTKIHMRATTITDFDRSEFVIPNKTLITNSFQNLTLSSPLNRIVIPVGVAYGTDTEKARQILIDIANDHPSLLDEPPPAAAFNLFGDSSLSLVLRGFLPDRANREGTITEIHAEIARRFGAAGIEIAFPQLDLHVRNGVPAHLAERESQLPTEGDSAHGDTTVASLPT